MNNDFRSQTTTLQTNFPFKGNGLVNDRLRLDVSGLAANTEYVLSYDTTNGTFAWSIPTNLPGLNTLYTANGTIDTSRVVTLDTGASLVFEDAVGENFIYLQPGTEFDTLITLTDYFRLGSHIGLEFKLQGGIIHMLTESLGLNVEEDPENSEIYFVSGRNSSLVLSENDFTCTIEEIGTVNGAEVTQSAQILLSPSSTYMLCNELLDFGNVENTIQSKWVGDGEGFGIYKYFDSITTYVVDNNTAAGGLLIADSVLTLEHIQYGPVSSEILLRSEQNNVAIVDFKLRTDFTAPILSYNDSVTNRTTHEINWGTDNLGLRVLANDDTIAPYIEFSVNNNNSVSYFYLVQADVDNSEESEADLTITNINGSASATLQVKPTTIRILASGTPTTAALLNVESTTQGFLPPRMTTEERDLIAAPMAGLMIYNMTTNKLNVYTTAWEQVTSA